MCSSEGSLLLLGCSNMEAEVRAAVLVRQHPNWGGRRGLQLRRQWCRRGGGTVARASGLWVSQAAV